MPIVTGPPSCRFYVPGTSRNPLFSRRTEKPYFFALKTAAFLTAKTTATVTERDAMIVESGRLI